MVIQPTGDGGAGREEILHCVQNDVWWKNSAMPIPMRHPELAKDLLARSTMVLLGLGAGREEILPFGQNDVGGEEWRHSSFCESLLAPCVILTTIGRKDLLARSIAMRTGLGAGREEILHCVQNDVWGGMASCLSLCVILSLRRACP